MHERWIGAIYMNPVNLNMLKCTYQPQSYVTNKYLQLFMFTAFLFL